MLWIKFSKWNQQNQFFLHDISVLYPAISTFVTKFYATPSRLVVIDSTEMRSNEGTTPGEPVAMTIYALGITPFVMMMIELITTKCKYI